MDKLLKKIDYFLNWEKNLNLEIKKNSLAIIIIETAHLSEEKKNQAMFPTVRFNYSTEFGKLE